jgi:biopolymer transport protein ExbB
MTMKLNALPLHLVNRFLGRQEPRPGLRSGLPVAGVLASLGATAAIGFAWREEIATLVERTNVIYVFEKGGPIMWPLLLTSVLGIGTVLERLFFLARERRKRDPEALERFMTAARLGHLEQAIRIGRSSEDFVLRSLGHALAHRERSRGNARLYGADRHDDIYVAEWELDRFRRGIPMLDTIITLAPLLGLLGTVTGMMGSFALIGGELGAPGAITGGIAEALIATTFGLAIAIVSLIPFNYLNSRLEEARREIDAAEAQLELQLHSLHVEPGDTERACA